MTLVVSRLKTQLRSIEVIIGEEEASKVVEICYALACRIEREGWRVLRYVREQLISQSSFPTLWFMLDEGYNNIDFSLPGKEASEPYWRTNICQFSSPLAFRP